MSAVYLSKLDAARNMARFYRVDLAPNLFGEVCVLRTWGRIGTRRRTMMETCTSREAAQASAAPRVQTKLRRGYAEA